MTKRPTTTTEKNLENTAYVVVGLERRIRTLESAVAELLHALNDAPPKIPLESLGKKD